MSDDMIPRQMGSSVTDLPESDERALPIVGWLTISVESGLNTARDTYE